MTLIVFVILSLLCIAVTVKVGLAVAAFENKKDTFVEAEMNYTVAGVTDVGIKKDTNQDSVCIKKAVTRYGNILFAMICDGMGGLDKGELASATIVREFSDWFEQELPGLLPDLQLEMLLAIWEKKIMNLNLKIATYGEKNHVSLGSTLTAMLFIDGKYLIAHVGDTRVYKIRNGIEQLTEDQTVVEQEIQKGALTREEAEKDARRNVLLQCIGASRQITPQFLLGEVAAGEVYMLCSDGFRHKFSEEEMLKSFRPKLLLYKEQMEALVRDAVETVKNRQEKDNISVVLVKVREQGGVDK